MADDRDRCAASVRCSRCQEINIVELLREGGHQKIGHGSTLDLSPGCDVCSILQTLMPAQPLKPSSPIYLISVSALARLEPGIDIKRHEGPGRKNYAKYVFVGQDIRYQERDVAMREAVGVDSSSEDGLALCLRKVHPLSVDIPLIKHWLGVCEKIHTSTCGLLPFEELSTIRLIDVWTRQIVAYPKDDQPYLCLSYVWGNCTQPRRALHSYLEDLPATIEDAIRFVQLVGKQYLWVDSICIDQGDNDFKTQQISIMHSIYRASWATIVALSGTSANSGLPRINPNIPVDQQKAFNLDKTRLLTAMPTLQQQCNESMWATRAWTFQEALLSPRCLYFTESQVYFECNATQSSESIDDTGSWFHNLSNTERFEKFDCPCHHPFGETIGKGVFRDPVVMDSDDNGIRKRRLGRYDDFVHQYSRRSMTYSSDILIACTAILGQFSSRYFNEGFFWGIPTEALPFSLLWNHESDYDPRQGFPSWSWTGWHGHIEKSTSLVDEMYPKANYQPPFNAWKKTQNGFSLIYKSRRPDEYCYRGKGYDMIRDAARSPPQDPKFNLRGLDQVEVGKMLFVECFFGSLKVDTAPFRSHFRRGMRISIDGALCELECFNDKAEEIVQSRLATGIAFILIDRLCVEAETSWKYDLLLLSYDKGEKTSSSRSAFNIFRRVFPPKPTQISVFRRMSCARLTPINLHSCDYADTVREVLSSLKLVKRLLILS
ncbi:HET-domain-containing protein [Cenococcum geophilum 1.58]|uniref:HET-domain-containing protein n=1 Tax=Cenococcum geophilum 1.58 TaxID=794803 RepID=UPI00358FB94A|nr:HET-domain-containing protein [Cenococcum geophilum 1.58]